MARDRYDDDRYDDDRDDRDERRRNDRYDDDYDDDYDDRPRGAPPPNYLAQAIITTLLCCWPCGVVAIIYAAQVNTKWAQGDSRGAYAASEKAKLWSWLSFGGFLVIMVLYVVLAVASAQ
jgi:hypothetical protein